MTLQGEILMKKPDFNKSIVASVCLVAPMFQPVVANNEGSSFGPDWDVTIGATVEYEAVSPGIDEYEASVMPYFDIEYKERFFLKAERGLGAYLFRSEGEDDFGFGVALSYDEGREESDARDQLRGMGDIDPSLEAVVFVEGELGPIDLELELAQGLDSDGHDGFRAELSAEVDGQINERLFVSGGPFLTYGNNNYLQSYYGVTSSQSLTSRYSEYDPSGGIESFGLELTARYFIDENWSLIGYAEYTQLVGDAKDSPIVDDEGFFGAGAGVAYEF